MRRVTFLMTVVLILMSGLALTQLWTLGPTSPRAIPAASSPLAEESALAFYAAVNAYLLDGDESSLRELLHPNFVNRQAGSTWSGSADDLLAQLESIRSLYPGIQVSARLVSVSDDLASMRLSIEHGHAADFAGAEIDPGDLLGASELLRIERDKVAERWSWAPVAGHLGSYPEYSIELPYSINTLLAGVQQFKLEGGHETLASPTAHLLLIVDSGKASIEVTSKPAIPAMTWRHEEGQISGPGPVESGKTLILEPMGAVYLPAGTAFQLWDLANGTTHMTALYFGPPVETNGPLSPFEAVFGNGPTSGVDLKEVGAHLMLAFGKATLLPDSAFPERSVEGLELVSVSSGSLDLAGSGGEARVRKAGSVRANLIGDHTLLASGDVAAIGPGAEINYRATGDAPVEAWAFSLVPIPDPTALDDANSEPSGSAPVPTPAPNPTPW